MTVSSSDEAAPSALGNRKPRPTIYDIARAVGVSPSTVSRALNKPGRINIKTEQKIRDAAENLGYQLNPMARALPTGRTGTIALVVSDITNPVYFDLIRGAERVTAAHGLTLVFSESQESVEQELQVARRLQTATDGLILVASRLADEEVRRLANMKPVVLVNRLVPGIPSVTPSLESGLRAAVDHLTELGHRSIAYLAGPTTSWTNRVRWETLFELAVAQGLSIVEIGPGDPTLQGGQEVLPRLRASGATAAIAYNDLMALGLMQAAKGVGIDVPGDLSLIGFDDIFGAELPTPALTSIRIPLTALGQHAANMLVSGEYGEDLSIGATLIVRGSTGVAAAPHH
jgi:DNA-binding LacI/PurR family transcriptional regulator